MDWERLKIKTSVGNRKIIMSMSDVETERVNVEMDLIETGREVEWILPALDRDQGQVQEHDN
jgi:hypothetical protein